MILQWFVKQFQLDFTTETPRLTYVEKYPRTFAWF
ncbi:hypothetical protein APED_29400 [Acanthopleuribacter pedis]